MRFFFRKIVIVLNLIIFILYFNASGQPKVTNLYDLIKSSVADSLAPASLVWWDKGINQNPFVKWLNKNPKSEEILDEETGQKIGTEYYKSGIVNLKINNQVLNGISTTISGKNIQGYRQVSISIGMKENFSGGDISILGNTKVKVTLLNPEDDVKWYKVKFPGKKDVWVVLEEEYIASQSNWFIITVYFDDEDYRKVHKN